MPASTIVPGYENYWTNLAQTSPSQLVRTNATNMLRQSGYDASGKPLSQAPLYATGPTTGSNTINLDAALGVKPVIPNPLDAVNQAIATYQQQLQANQALVNQIDQAKQDAAVKQVTDLYPQFKSNVSQIGADIGDWASGNVSASTKNAITQMMAERGVAGGFGPDSPATNAALLSLLGKTAEDLQGKAITGQQTLVNTLPRADLTDVTKLAISPTDLFKSIYEGNLLSAYTQAAPTPTEAYRLAMQNAQGGLRGGYNTGRGPYANTPTTGSNADVMALLSQLINRGTGGGSTGAGGTSTYYQNNPYAPPTSTADYTGDPEVDSFYSLLDEYGDPNSAIDWSTFGTAPQETYGGIPSPLGGASSLDEYYAFPEWYP